jgi:hypothetical protein
MTVAKRVGGPAVLEINITPAVKIPDKVAQCLINNDLPHGTKPTLPGAFKFSIKPQAVLEKWNTSLEGGERLRPWESILHNALSLICYDPV